MKGSLLVVSYSLVQVRDGAILGDVTKVRDFWLDPPVPRVFLQEFVLVKETIGHSQFLF